jgi:hypothetical protein
MLTRSPAWLFRLSDGCKHPSEPTARQLAALVADPDVSGSLKATRRRDKGSWVFGGGLENQEASIVATDGTVTDGPYPEAIGGLCVVDVPSREEALEWAAKTAIACPVLKRPGSSCPTRP